MSKTKIFSVLMMLFVSFIYVSCDNEPIDPELNSLVQNNNNNNDGGNSGGGGNSSNDYWPAALNNQWTMSMNGVAQQPMKMVSVNNINGYTYYTFSQTTGSSGGSAATAITRLRKNAGNYYFKVEDLDVNVGGFTGVQTGYEMLLLKDYLTAGNTWNGNYTQTTTYNNPIIPVVQMNTNYTGTILSTGNTETIDGETFTNVIKMRLHQVTAMTGLPDTITDTEYWFSKNVGPIKYITTSNGASYTSLLIDYDLN